MCFACFEDNIRPCLSSNNVLMLSWKTTYSSSLALHKVSNPNNAGKLVCECDKLSLSWALGVTLHFVRPVATAPLPNVLRLPDWPLQSSWIWCGLSTYQWIANLIWSAPSVSFKWRVTFKCFKIHLNLPQSSLSSSCTRVVRNYRISRGISTAGA